MKPENWISVAVAVWTAIALFVGPRIAVRLSLKQFRSQKWWESQNEVYTQLLEDLSMIYSYHINLMDEIETRSEYNPGPEIVAAAARAKHRVEQQSVTGAYIISEPAASALTKYQRASYKADAESHPHDAYDIRSSAAKECLEVIKIEATTVLS